MLYKDDNENRLRSVALVMTPTTYNTRMHNDTAAVLAQPLYTDNVCYCSTDPSILFLCWLYTLYAVLYTLLLLMTVGQ
jgi:hypothetical protein